MKGTEKMERLFTEWKDKYPSDVFVKDGIVNDALWNSQPVKPLFLLKEAYGGECDWSLVEHISNPKSRTGEPRTCGDTWRRITQWAYGILNTTEAAVAPFKPSNLSYTYGNEWLNRIAVMNVKKIDNGKSSSDMQNINQYAISDGELLRKQISIIDPTVIICGYTISSLNIILNKTENCGVKDCSDPNDNWYYFTNIGGKRVVVLDYYHPSNHYPDLLNYYGLMNIYQLALKKQKNGGI